VVALVIPPTIAAMRQEQCTPVKCQLLKIFRWSRPEIPVCFGNGDGVITALLTQVAINHEEILIANHGFVAFPGDTTCIK
jgi:hypothetical protein